MRWSMAVMVMISIVFGSETWAQAPAPVPPDGANTRSMFVWNTGTVSASHASRLALVTWCREQGVNLVFLHTGGLFSNFAGPERLL